MGIFWHGNTILQTTNSHALCFRCDADYWTAARCLRRTARRLLRPHGFRQFPRPAEPSADDLPRLRSDWRLSLPPTRPAGAPALWQHAPGSGRQAEIAAGGAGSGCREVCTALPWGRFGFAGLDGTHERPRAPFTAMRGQVTRLHGAYGPLRAPSAGWPQIKPDWPYQLLLCRLQVQDYGFEDCCSRGVPSTDSGELPGLPHARVCKQLQ